MRGGQSRFSCDMHRDSIFLEEEEVSQVRLVARFSFRPGAIAPTPVDGPAAQSLGRRSVGATGEMAVSGHIWCTYSATLIRVETGEYN